MSYINNLPKNGFAKKKKKQNKTTVRRIYGESIAEAPKETFASGHAELSNGSIFGGSREEVKGTQ